MRTRRNHVGLEAAITAFDADAHIAAARKIGHFGVGVGAGAEHQVGGEFGIGARFTKLLTARPNHTAFIVGHHRVGEVALGFQCTHGDHVLSVARYGHRPAQTADTIVAALSGVAGGEDEEHRLLTGNFGQGIPRGSIVTGRNGVVLVSAPIAPTVVGDEGVGHGGLLLQEGIRNGWAGLEVDGENEELGVGSVTAELSIGHRTLGGPLDFERTNAAAGDGPGHVGPVAVAVGQEIGLGSDREDAGGGEVGVSPVDAGVIDIDHHVAAGQSPVRYRIGDIRGAPEQVGRAIIEQFAAVGLFDQMHLGRLSQREERVGRYIDRDQRAERAALTSDLADPERLQAREGIGIGQGEHQAIARLQRPTVDNLSEQFWFEFEGGMPRRDRSDIGVEGQALDRLVGTLHQEGIDRQVRDDLQLLLFQSATGLRVGLVGELDNVETGFWARHQRLGQRQRFARASIYQGIAQHQRARIVPQLIYRLGGVAGAPGKFSVLWRRLLAGIERANSQALGGHMGRDGHGATDGRGHGRADGRRGEPRSRRSGVHGGWLYPAVQPQGTHRQGDGNNQASKRAHDENGITAFSPWSAHGGLPPPSAGFG